VNKFAKPEKRFIRLALENVLRAAFEKDLQTTGSRMANPDDKINQLYITLSYARCSVLPFELSGQNCFHPQFK